MNRFKLGDTVYTCDRLGYLVGKIVTVFHGEPCVYEIETSSGRISTSRFIASTKDELRNIIDKYNSFAVFIVA